MPFASAFQSAFQPAYRSAFNAYSGGFVYTMTDRAIDLGNLTAFSIPDLSGNANVVTQESGIYKITNGTTDQLFATATDTGTDLSALGAISSITLRTKSAAFVGFTFNLADGSAVTSGSLADNIWEDRTLFFAGVTADNFYAYTNGATGNWSDVIVTGANGFAHYKFYDSADASLDGKPIFDSGTFGLHSVCLGCSSGSGEPGILQTAGEDFNINTTTYAGKTVFVPESPTTAGEDILGNPLDFQRPNERVANLAATDAQVRVTDAAALDSLNAWGQWFYYDGTDGTIVNLGGATLDVTGGVLASTGLTAATHYVGNKTTAVAATTTLSVGWNYIGATFDNFSPTSDPLALRTYGHAIGYDEPKTITTFETNRNATKSKYGANWILNGGTWDDSGIWINAATWND